MTQITTTEVSVQLTYVME